MAGQAGFFDGDDQLNASSVMREIIQRRLQPILTVAL
jgi:hypothetical protein